MVAKPGRGPRGCPVWGLRLSCKSMSCEMPFRCRGEAVEGPDHTERGLLLADYVIVHNREPDMNSTLRRRSPALLVGLFALAASLPEAAQGQRQEPVIRPAAACRVAPPPNSLWSLARCCAQDLSSDSYCRYHSKTDGFIILKDNSPAKPDAYLIIPTTRVTGIEDRQIFAPPVANFWAFGWQQAQIHLNK